MLKSHSLILVIYDCCVSKTDFSNISTFEIYKQKRTTQQIFPRAGIVEKIKFSRKLIKQHIWHSIFDAGQNLVRKRERIHSGCSKKNSILVLSWMSCVIMNKETATFILMIKIVDLVDWQKVQLFVRKGDKNSSRIRCNTYPLIDSCNISIADMTFLEFPSMELNRRNTVC